MQDIIDAILGGAHDDRLDLITETVRERKQLLAKRLVSQISIGDRVRIKAVSPKYLIGYEATVTGVGSRDQLVIKLDYPVGRFTDRPFACPASVLEKVE